MSLHERIRRLITACEKAGVCVLLSADNRIFVLPRTADVDWPVVRKAIVLIRRVPNWRQKLASSISSWELH